MDVKLLTLMLKELTEMIKTLQYWCYSSLKRQAFDCANNFTSINVCENQNAMSILSTAVICYKGDQGKSIVHLINTTIRSLQNGESCVCNFKRTACN